MQMWKEWTKKVVARGSSKCQSLERKSAGGGVGGKDGVKERWQKDDIGSKEEILYSAVVRKKKKDALE